jgi:glycosyltransferase involved in cell wall biosynthesis
MKIKILFVMPTMGYGGTERQIMELCRGLDKSRYEISLLVLKEAAGYLDNESFPGQVLRLRLSHCYNLWRLPAFIRILSMGRYDIIHSLLPVANFWTGLARPFVKARRWIGSSRNIDYPPPKWLFWLADFISFHLFCDTILINSESGKKDLVHSFHLPPVKIRVIGNGYDFSSLRKTHKSRTEWRKSMGIPEDVQLVTTVARLVEQKGLSYYLDMIGVVKKSALNVYFLLVGDGPEREALNKKATTLELSGLIRLTGFRQDIGDILQASDVFVLPSIYEGCPNAVLEALAMGCPVVTTDIPPHREFLRHEHNALLVPPRDPEALAKDVQRALKDSALRTKLAVAGQMTVEKRFTHTKMVNTYDEFYRSVLERPSH